jgi:hypothetical protein
MTNKRAKNYKEFGINRPGFTDGIKVRVYKTPESMRKGYLAERSKFDRRKNTEDISDSVGIFFTIGYMLSDHIEGRYTGDIYGIMFLNEKFITPEVVIHECTHAVFSHEEDIVRFKMDYHIGRLEINHEERFAYYMDWLSAEVLQLLQKAGYLR